MIDAIITGKIYSAPERRVSKTGSEYLTAKVRAATGNGEALFVNCIVFDADAARSLLALQSGDSLSISGELTPGAWLDRGGEPRPSLSMVVSKVLTLYNLDKKRKSSKATPASAPQPQDDMPEPPAWLDDGFPV